MKLNKKSWHYRFMLMTEESYFKFTSVDTKYSCKYWYSTIYNLFTVCIYMMVCSSLPLGLMFWYTTFFSDSPAIFYYLDSGLQVIPIMIGIIVVGLSLLITSLAIVIGLFLTCSFVIWMLIIMLFEVSGLKYLRKRLCKHIEWEE